MKLMGRFIHQALRHFWRLLAMLLILCALVVQLGRMATPMVADYRAPLIAYLTESLGLHVEIKTLAARWESLLPVLALEGLVVSTPTGKPVLEIESALAEVDLLESLWERRLRFADVEFLGVRSNFVEGEGGELHLEGLGAEPSVPKESATNYTLDDLRGIFLVGRKVNLIDLHTRIRLQSGNELELIVNHLLLERGQNQHRLSATIQLDDRPEAVELIMEGSGDPFDVTEFGSSAYVKIEEFPTDKLLALLARRYWQELPEGEWQKNSHASVEAWLTLKPDVGLSWVGNVGLSGLPFELQGKDIPFRSIQSEVIGYAHFDGSWLLQLQQIQMQWGGTSATPFSLQVSSSSEHALQIKADKLVLSDWSRWVNDTQLLPEKLQGVANSLNPAGEIRNLNVRWPIEAPKNFDLRANLVRVSVGAWMGAPALTGVDGYIQTAADMGFVELDSQHGFSMHYTSVYESPMVYEAASGQVAWWIHPEQQAVYVNSGPIHLEGEDGQATGFLYIDAPLHREDKTLELLLQIGIENSAAKYHKKYVPFVVSEHLRTWLDGAIDEGRVAQGGFLFHGYIGATPIRPPNIQLWLDIEQASLNYQPPWPALSHVDAKLWLDSTHLLVTADKGVLYNSQLESAQVELLPSDGQGLNLLIKGQLAGPLADGYRVLNETPLADITHQTFTHWEMAGRYQAALDLLVPLAESRDKFQFAVDVDVVNSRLKLPFLNLEADQLVGKLQISDQHGVAIERMTGNVWNKPLTIDSSLNSAGTLLSLKIDALADIDDLIHWAGFAPVPQASGVSRYVTQIDIPWGAETPTSLDTHAQTQTQTQAQVSVHSNLSGLKLALPEPLAKGADEVASLVLSIPLERDELIVTGRVDHTLNTVLQWKKGQHGFAFDRGDVQLFSPATLPDAPMISLGGKLDRVDVKAWIAAFDGQWSALRNASATMAPADPALEKSTALVVADEEPSNEGLPLYITLQARHVIVDGEHDVGLTRLASIKKPDRWLFNLRNERVTGDVDLPIYADAPMELTLRHLRLPLWPSDKSVAEELLPDGPNTDEQAELLWRILKPLPPAQVAIANLYLDERSVGQLAFETRMNEDTFVVDKLNGSVYGLALASSGVDAGAGGTLSWSHGLNQSSYAGRIRTGDLGTVMTDLGVAKLIESNSALFDVDFQWPGNPYSVSLEQVTGRLDLQIKQGRFMRADASAGNALMRLMGIFNFDTWIRRLQLDFSDVYASGMAYDEVKGSLAFAAGQVGIDPPVTVKTPSSKMQMGGKIDLVENTIDTRLTVNLPVLDNLTFLAAVSAGLPVAAGVFVASRLFEKQFDKLTSVNYQVSGALDAPVVAFKQPSTNTSKSRTADGAVTDKPIAPLEPKETSADEGDPRAAGSSPIRQEPTTPP